ncbi:MAG: NUDIX domain-containing protein [Patescibacteria group bacterium]|nr:NUDIX domain-containing protein [Patescibacteria group bacterium]
MKGSVAIIFSGKKVLLFLRDNIPTIPNPNFWSLPGGCTENGESPHQTIVRELREEVSYVPKSLIYLGYHIDFLDLSVVNVFFSRVSGEEAKNFAHTGDEGQEIKFFSFDQLFTIQLVPSLKLYLAKYQKFVKQLLEDDNLVPTPELIGLKQD